MRRQWITDIGGGPSLLPAERIDADLDAEI